MNKSRLSDLPAHLGGFVGGLLLGVGLLLTPLKFIRSRRVNLASAVIVVGWLVLTWWLALRRS